MVYLECLFGVKCVECGLRCIFGIGECVVAVKVS